MSAAETSFPDLVPTILALSRADKLRLVQVIVGDLARDEGVPLLQPGASYPVWTPLDAFDAAAVMLREIEAREAAQ